MYAARPGLRLWKATIDGKVLSTMIFKASIIKGEPLIETIDLPSQVELPPQGDQKQFGSLLVFNNQFIVTWQGSCVWVMDPGTGYIIGCHSNLGCVVDVSVCGNELFILSKGEEHFIRKIVFETMLTKTIVVEEIDLNNPQEIAKAQRGSSISQFEDQDKFDKVIDVVGTKMKGAFSDVKSRMKEIKDQIKSRESSEDDRGSESDRFLASPHYLHRKDNESKLVLSGEAYYTSDDKSDENDKEEITTITENDKEEITTSTELDKSDDNSTRPFESSSEFMNSFEKSPELPTKNVQEQNDKLKPFQHLSKEAFPTDIVFEGTSIGTSPKKRRKGKKKGNREFLIFF